MPTAQPPAELTLRQLVDRGERPFPAHAQVDRYFPATAIENARRRVSRAIERGDGPALVVGGVGTGKSLLLQVLAAQFHERFDVVLLACTRLATRRALLQAILFEIGLPYHIRDEGHLRLGLLDHLLSGKQNPAELLLLVDEAQAMPVTLLDELRVMTNLVQRGVPRVRVVLAGSPALEESFAHPELESFSQRLAARCYLASLSRDETAQFVRAQLAASGAAVDEILRPEAWEAVFEATDGVPRLVNQLCDRAITVALAENCKRIDRRVVQEAWSDLQQLPSPWETSETRETASTVIEFGGLSDGAAPQRPSAFETSVSDIVRSQSDVERVVESVRIAAPCEPEKTAVPTGGITRSDSIPVAESSKPVAARVRASQDNPFSESFDEEEVIIDSFASWSELFGKIALRVESTRDGEFASRVRAALDTCDGHGTEVDSPATEPEDSLLARPEETTEDSSFGQQSLRGLPEPKEIERWEFADTELPNPIGQTYETIDDVPSIRLANVSHQDWDDSSSSGGIESGYDLPPDRDAPIVLVEEDADVEPHRGVLTGRRPQVRRQEYRRLFSRLRSG